MADMSFDVVYVGAGTKNLVNAIYATRYGGLTVGMFEDRYEAGSGWSTEESPAPGFLANHCSHMHCGAWYYKAIWEDFPQEWEAYGPRLVYPKVATGTVFLEDDSWIGTYTVFDDPSQEKSAKLIARFSPKDAEVWLKIHDLVRKHIGPAFFEVAFNPPQPLEQPDAIDQLLTKPPPGLNPLWNLMSPAQLSLELFESREAQMLFMRAAQSAGIQPESPGLGLAALIMIEGYMITTILAGGNHQAAHFCNRVIKENGGKIYTRHTVNKILIENGRAIGVRLADGTEIEAKKAVVCGANPEQLVFELTGPEYWDPEIPRKVKNIERDWTVISWYTWALHEPPKYKAEAFDPNLADMVWMCLGQKEVDYLLQEHYRRRLGMWPEPDKFNLVVSDYSLYDPTFAPPGKACVLTEQFVLPATAYSEEEWKAIEKRHAEEILYFWQKYAPNMTWDNVIGYVPITPFFTARHAKTFAPTGNWSVIDCPSHQFGRFRPIPELADLRNFPIENLYPCSAAWHQASGGHMQQGYWVYKIMAERFGLDKPWEEKGRSW